MADNRTEKATPKRRTKAREHGQVLRSRDLVSAITLLGVVCAMAWSPGVWVNLWQRYFGNMLSAAGTSGWESGGTTLFSATAGMVLLWAGPLLAVAFVVAVASTLAQGVPTFAVEALAPNFNKLNPVNNLQQLFSLAGVSRVLKSLLPTSIILYLAIGLIRSHAEAILHATRLHGEGLLALLGSLCVGLAYRSSMVFLAWSGLDYFLQWRTYEKSLRMTKQEVRDEGRENEGNPEIRGRIRKLRRELARKSLQKAMQRATAVIVNPTHYAVALEYRAATMAAPVVVAKGQNFLALRIKELARWNEIPIVENPPLAQALYKATEVGQAIPPKLYVAVAELLAFVYRAQMRMRGAGVRT
ncbi:MAG TPA: EscU/YscU/HrcU family type III secretion system export apparatus switch protein [Candidatus Acidoferrum sp.]|nr:EscU/YscU/HrcU family type III secretion system export apparatus switch protein [Candidatus Acidoferrum sp.]